MGSPDPIIRLYLLEPFEVYANRFRSEVAAAFGDQVEVIRFIKSNDLINAIASDREVDQVWIETKGIKPDRLNEIRSILLPYVGNELYEVWEGVPNREDSATQNSREVLAVIAALLQRRTGSRDGNQDVSIAKVEFRVDSLEERLKELSDRLSESEKTIFPQLSTLRRGIDDINKKRQDRMQLYIAVIAAGGAIAAAILPNMSAVAEVFKMLIR